MRTYIYYTLRRFNVPYPFRGQEVHSFGDLIAEHNEFVRRQRTRPVRIHVVVDAPRISQHALEFAQFRVLHDDEQGVCATNNGALCIIHIITL